MNGKKLISFVIPCYRSENTVMKVVDEIASTMASDEAYDYEVILVNDCSPDGVWNVIKNRAVVDKRITGINLAKNFGQHSALMAGYHRSKGDYVVSLDDDGQTPASEVFKLIDKLEEGFDVVYATYPEYHQTLFRKLGSDFATKMNNYMFDIKKPMPKGSSYFVMRRFIVDEILKYDHAYTYVAGLVLRATRNIAMVPVEHRNRLEGSSGYSLKSLISLWLNGFTAFSVKPLEISAYIGVLCSAGGFIFVVITIIRKLINPDIQAGWSSLISIIMIIGGIIMLMLGLIGEYIGRIYICLNNAPQYVIKEICHVEDSDNENSSC